MAHFDRTNTGILFKEADKQSERHPDFTGNLNVDGVEYRLSGWKKESNGKQFLSLSVSPKRTPEKKGLMDTVKAMNPDKFDIAITEDDLKSIPF